MSERGFLIFVIFLQFFWNFFARVEYERNLGREREKKKLLVSNSIRTQPRLENSKTSSKKIQKIKKLHSGFISIQTGMR